MRALTSSFFVATLACGSGNGGRCTVASDCQGSLVCVAAVASGSDADSIARVCMRPCDHDAGDGVDQRLCSDGTVCSALGGARVCYVGGGHPIHTACATDLDCEAGTVCAPDTMTCAQACTLGTNAPCVTNETCIAVAGGICRPTAVVVDAGH